MLPVVTAMGGKSGVLVAWETASEIDTAGFHVWRRWASETGEIEFIRVTDDLIPSLGGFSWGAEYEFHDATAIYRRKYYYYLEDITYSGESTFHEPVIVEWRKKKNAGK